MFCYSLYLLEEWVASRAATQITALTIACQYDSIYKAWRFCFAFDFTDVCFPKGRILLTYTFRVDYKSSLALCFSWYKMWYPLPFESFFVEKNSHPHKKCVINSFPRVFQKYIHQHLTVFSTILLYFANCKLHIFTASRSFQLC